jgi:hypothetical protein
VKTVLAAGLALAVVPAIACAQEADGSAAPVPAETASDTEQSYPAAYFAEYAPRTAYDMLRRVPGFSIRTGDGGRGLGAASTNVLVNSRRLSGKSDDTLSQLERISAANVMRIDLVDAASLDQPGLSGQVANVIVQSGGLSGQFSWRGEYRPRTDRAYLGQAEASLSGTLGTLEYSLSAEHGGYRGGVTGPITLVTAAGDLIERQDFVTRPGSDSLTGRGGLKWRPADGVIANFNASYTDFSSDQTTLEIIDGTLSPDRTRDRRSANSGHAYEIGADVELPLVGGRLKLIGLDRFERNDYAESAITDFAGDGLSVGGRYASVSDAGERIGRAEFGWSAGGADWQLAGEAAFNRLDRVAALFALDADGAFQEIAFPDNVAGVKEDRYEASLSYSRPLAANLDMQLVAAGEISQIAQTGRNETARSFRRPKGSASLAWQPGPGWDVSVKLAREVGQLSFSSFLARAFIADGNGNAGNADLVPQQSWETDVEIKKTLGAWGSTTLRLYDRQIEDRVEIIPVDGGESPGNIDSAWRRGLDWDSTILLSPIGFTGARLNLSVELYDSAITDPLLGTLRPLSGNQYRELFAGLRHDVPRSQWAWGAEVYHNRIAPSFRLNEISEENEGPAFAKLFVEHKDIAGLKVQLEAANLLGARYLYGRTLYDGLRDTAQIVSIEDARLDIGPILRMRVEGNF